MTSSSPDQPSSAVVTVYTLPDCVQCTQTKKRLDALKVPYRTVDLATDDKARDRLKDEGLMAAPIVEAPDGQRWSGFRIDKLKDLAAQHRAAGAAAVAQRCFAGAATSAVHRASPAATHPHRAPSHSLAATPTANAELGR